MTQDIRHTPAPWKVAKLGQHWNNPQLQHLAIHFGEDEENVCDTVYEVADAYLIAAAPELLRSLLDAIAPFNGDDCPPRWVSIARKAIDKARGIA